MPERRRDNLVPLALIAAGVLFVGVKEYFDDQTNKARHGVSAEDRQAIKDRQKAQVDRIESQDRELRGLRAEVLSLKARLEVRH